MDKKFLNFNKTSNGLFEGLEQKVLDKDNTASLSEAVKSGLIDPGQIYGSTAKDNEAVQVQGEGALPPAPPKQKIWDTLPGRMAMSSLMMQGMGTLWRGAGELGGKVVDGVDNLVSFSEDNEEIEKGKSNSLYGSVKERENAENQIQQQQQQIQQQQQQIQQQQQRLQQMQPPQNQGIMAHPVSKMAMSAMMMQGANAAFRGLGSLGKHAIDAVGFIGFSEQVDQNFAMSSLAKNALITAGTATLGGVGGYINHKANSQLAYRKYVKDCESKGVHPIPFSQFNKGNLIKNVGLGVAGGAAAGAVGSSMASNASAKSEKGEVLRGALGLAANNSKNASNTFGNKSKDIQSAFKDISKLPGLDPAIVSSIKSGNISPEVMKVIGSNSTAKAIINEKGVGNIFKDASHVSGSDTFKDVLSSGISSTLVDPKKLKRHNKNLPIASVYNGVTGVPKGVGKGIGNVVDFFKGFVAFSNPFDPCDVNFSATSVVAGATLGGIAGTAGGYWAGNELGKIDYQDEKKMSVVKNLPEPNKDEILKKWQERGMITGGILGTSAGVVAGANYKSNSDRNKDYTAKKVEEEFRSQIIRGYGLPEENKSMILELVEAGKLNVSAGQRLMDIVEHNPKNSTGSSQYHHYNKNNKGGYSGGFGGGSGGNTTNPSNVVNSGNKQGVLNVLNKIQTNTP